VQIASAAGMLMLVAAQAQAAPKDVVVLKGCTQFMPPACLGMISGGAAYGLISDKQLPRGVGLTVTGRLKGVSACLGKTVQVISWKPNKMACPR
jgi:hypothetical protein